MRNFLGMGLIALAGVGVANAQLKFWDTSSSRGIGSYVCAPGMGGGVSAVDYDQDGDIDVFVPEAEGVGNSLYQNDGTGNFTDVAAGIGLGSLTRDKVAVWFDYDGDADLDLIVQGDCFDPAAVPGAGDPCPNRNLYLYNNTGGVFSEVSAAAGLPAINVTSDIHGASITTGDLNADGYLDLVVTVWRGPNFVFLNNGDGTFSDISVSSGVFTADERNWQPLVYDFNQDGLNDIYINVDFQANHLWINNGDLTFTDIAASAGVDFTMNDMGLTIGDYDNDGDFDMYATNVYAQAPGERNLLMRNDTVGNTVLFTEVSVAAGVDNSDWGWGTYFFDADRDGWLDIAATNGFFNPPFDTDASKFFHNNGDGTFSDWSAQAVLNDTAYGSGLIAADIDRDGDQDVLQTQVGGSLRVLESRRSGGQVRNHWIAVQPRQPGDANYFAVGATVRVSVGGSFPISAARYITGSTSHLSQEPFEAHFGIGKNRSNIDVTVEWPDGTSKTVTGLRSKQVVVVEKD